MIMSSYDDNYLVSRIVNVTLLFTLYHKMQCISNIGEKIFFDVI